MTLALFLRHHGEEEMIPGLSPKTSPPSPHTAGIVLVPDALSKAPVLSMRTPLPSPHSAGVVLVPAALSTTPGLSPNPQHPALISKVFTVVQDRVSKSHGLTVMRLRKKFLTLCKILRFASAN